MGGGLLVQRELLKWWRGPSLPFQFHPLSSIVHTLFVFIIVNDGGKVPIYHCRFMTNRHLFCPGFPIRPWRVILEALRTEALRALHVEALEAALAPVLGDPVRIIRWSRMASHRHAHHLGTLYAARSLPTNTASAIQYSNRSHRMSRHLVTFSNY